MGSPCCKDQQGLRGGTRGCIVNHVAEHEVAKHAGLLRKLARDVFVSFCRGGRWVLAADDDVGMRHHDQELGVEDPRVNVGSVSVRLAFSEFLLYLRPLGGRGERDEPSGRSQSAGCFQSVDP
eukprot:9495292-Pyramimonas_sp.AAC.1